MVDTAGLIAEARRAIEERLERKLGLAAAVRADEALGDAHAPTADTAGREIEVVFRISAGRYGDSRAMDLDDDELVESLLAELAPLLEDTGRWNRFEGTIRDGKLSVEANGKPWISDRPASSDGPITLSVPGPCDWANIYVQDRE